MDAKENDTLARHPCSAVPHGGVDLLGALQLDEGTSEERSEADEVKK